MSVEAWAAVGAVALVVLAISMAALAVTAIRLASDARGTLASMERLTTSMDRDLPATVADLRALAASLRTTSDGLEPRLDRLDRLADEAEATLVSVRTAADSVGEITHGPLAVIGGVSRRLRDVGQGIEEQTERLRRRRRSQGELDESDHDPDAA